MNVMNGISAGLLLFMLSSGLTLIFSMMGVLNFAHASFYMVGAYAGALVAAKTGSFWLAVPAALACAALVGVVIEVLIIRRLYARDHLYQVLATFGLILFFNGLIAWGVGRAPLNMDVPPLLSGFVEIVPGVPYPVYRLAVMAARALFHLPYYRARMEVIPDGEGIIYRSHRLDKTGGQTVPAAFEGSYRPVSAVYAAVPGTLEHFLTERYCLYAQGPDGGLRRTEVHHRPWPLQRAEAEITTHSMSAAGGLPVSGPPAPFMSTPMGGMRIS